MWEVRAAAESLIEIAESKGFSTSVSHSRTNIGDSSYIKVYKSVIGRAGVGFEARVSDHGTGVRRSLDYEYTAHMPLDQTDIDRWHGILHKVEKAAEISPTHADIEQQKLERKINDLKLAAAREGSHNRSGRQQARRELRKLGVIENPVSLKLSDTAEDILLAIRVSGARAHISKPVGTRFPAIGSVHYTVLAAVGRSGVSPAIIKSLEKKGLLRLVENNKDSGRYYEITQAGIDWVDENLPKGTAFRDKVEAEIGNRKIQ